MILDATTKTIEFKLDGAPAANQLPASVSYADYTASALTPGASDTISNSGTAVTLVAAPAASTQRQVKSVHIYNADTAPRTVTVQLNNNATLRILVKAVLAVGDSLVYEWGRGWFRVPNASTVESGFFGDGNAAAPSITFVLDPDTGLYRPAANQLGIAVAGAQAIQVDAAQLGLASGLVARMLSQNRFRHLNSLAQARRTAAQTITTGTETAIAFTAADDADTDALHDTVTNNDRIFANLAGKYLVWGFNSWVAGTGAYRALFIYTVDGAGADVLTAAAAKIAPTSGVSMYVAAPVGLANLAVGESVRMKVQHDQGTDLNTGICVLGMAYIGE